MRLLELAIKLLPGRTPDTVRTEGVSTPVITSRRLIEILLGLDRARLHVHALVHKLLVAIAQVVLAGNRLALVHGLRIPLLRTHAPAQHQDNQYKNQHRDFLPQGA